MGTQLYVLKRYEEAIASYHNALKIKPDFAEAQNNLGIVLAALGCYKEAIASYSNALSIKPAFADAHRNKGFAWLAMGDFDTGWAEYEWRWGTAHGWSEKRSFTQPLWFGMEDIAGKTILLHGARFRHTADKKKSTLNGERKLLSEGGRSQTYRITEITCLQGLLVHWAASLLLFYL